MRDVERVKLNQNLKKPEQDPLGFVPPAHHRLALPSLTPHDQQTPLGPSSWRNARVPLQVSGSSSAQLSLGRVLGS